MKYLFVFLFLFTTLPLIAQGLSAVEKTALDKLVMRDIPEDSPGAAVGILRNGKVIYERYAGLADLDTERPITANTRFNLASNGKQFTALCVARLIEAGKLALTDDVRKYLPELYPDLESPLTVQHLITHTSGVRDMNSLWGLQGKTWWKNSFTNDDALALLSNQTDLNFPSGTAYSYSNSNYILLAILVERVSGQSFRAYSDQLFTDLGMTSTYYCDDHTVPVPDLARPYFNFDTWKTYEWLSDLHGDGALFSTLPDQLRWEKMIQTGKSKALSAEFLAASQERIDPKFGYGYGLEIDTYRGLPVRTHDGSTGAWKATTLRFPTENVTIVVMNNTGKFFPWNLARELAYVVLEGKLEETKIVLRPEEVGPEVATEELLGTYHSGGFYFRFVERADGLYLEREGRSDVKLERETANMLHEVTDPTFRQAFTRDSTGALRMT
ncbi:MAG: serine hydrolase domain-containing protein, partial [Bacteroidota bacterium]